jgi:hypothetical protein
MAGIRDELNLEDMIGIAEFQVATGRIPPAGEWVDELIEKAQLDRARANIQGMLRGFCCGDEE